MNEAREASDHRKTSINKWVNQFRDQALGNDGPVSPVSGLQTPLAVRVVESARSWPAFSLFASLTQQSKLLEGE